MLHALPPLMHPCYILLSDVQCFVGLQEYKERAGAQFEEAVHEFKKAHPTFIPVRVGPCQHAVVNFDAKIACLPALV